MAVYERLEGGEVAERVQTVDGSHEDTRLGVAVLEERGGWRLAQPDPAPTGQEQDEPSREGGEDGVRDSGAVGRAPRARPRSG